MGKKKIYMFEGSVVFDQGLYFVAGEGGVDFMKCQPLFGVQDGKKRRLPTLVCVRASSVCCVDGVSSGCRGCYLSHVESVPCLSSV